MVRVFTIDPDGNIEEVLSDAEKVRREQMRHVELTELLALLLILSILYC